jgi:zinc protease
MMLRRAATSVWCLALLVVLIGNVPAHAFEIREVTSPLGIKALLVEDYAVPIVTVSVSFRGGSTQDPAGKEGMSNLLSTLFDEGAGAYDSKAFQARL